MRKLLLLALVGLGAQLVDGSLGMAYGVTSTTLLLAIGTNPAAASATVHLAEIGTTLASGASHWRFGNVDWKVVARSASPARSAPSPAPRSCRALHRDRRARDVGDPALARPLLLVRFTAAGLPKTTLGKPLRKRFLTPLGLVAGFVDATGGGGWGPVGTPAHPGQRPAGAAQGRSARSTPASSWSRSPPASASSSASAPRASTPPGCAALLVGGLVAAPIAAWLVRHVPPRVLGSRGRRRHRPDQRPHAAALSDWIAAPAGAALGRLRGGLPGLGGRAGVHGPRPPRRAAGRSVAPTVR